MPNANPAASRQRPQCNVSLEADRSKIIFHDLSLPARRFLIPLSDSNFSIKLVSYGKHLTSTFLSKCNLMSDIPTWDISYFALAKNLFTKYCCPLPVTFGVFVTMICPSGFVTVRSLISNQPASMLFCVGEL